MESKQFRSLMEAAMQVAINEDHMKGEEVIVFGMKGVVVKEVGSDGDTENDEIYQVKFEDGSVKNIPARDMEMQSDESDKRKPSENEAEDTVNENMGCMNPTIAKHVGRTIGRNIKESVELDEAPKADMRKTGSEMLRMMPKDLKSKIEKGQLKVVDSAPSWLGGKSEFQVLQYQPVSGRSIGGQRDPYIMVIVSNPKRKPMKIFAYYGTHPSPKALMFAKNNKLLESVELDEASRPMQFPGAMSGGKMKGKFTNAQLKQLKDAYAKIGRINPSSKAYENLTAFLDAQDKNVLQQLANARIQFISSLASNRVNRLKKESVELDEGRKPLEANSSRRRTLATHFAKIKDRRKHDDIHQSPEAAELVQIGKQVINRLRNKSDKKESVESEEVSSDSLEEKKKSFRDIPDAVELIRKFDAQGVGIDIPAINNKRWGTPGFTTEDFKRGDSVVGRRGNHAGLEYVVHSNHPNENHMTVRVPRKTDGKIQLVQVSPSNFGRPKSKSRKFPGPVPRPRQK